MLNDESVCLWLFNHVFVLSSLTLFSFWMSSQRTLCYVFVRNPLYVCINILRSHEPKTICTFFTCFSACLTYLHSMVSYWLPIAFLYRRVDHVSGYMPLAVRNCTCIICGNISTSFFKYWNGKGSLKEKSFQPCLGGICVGGRTMWVGLHQCKHTIQCNLLNSQVESTLYQWNSMQVTFVLIIWRL